MEMRQEYKTAARCLFAHGGPFLQNAKHLFFPVIYRAYHLSFAIFFSS